MRFCSHGNFFALPNEIFLWGLTAGELAVYSFLSALARLLKERDEAEGKCRLRQTVKN